MGRLAWLLAAGLLLGAPVAATPIDLSVTAVPLDYGDAKHRDVGKLRYLAGFRLNAGDDAFGGFSGLLLDDRGNRLRAVSDAGHLLTLTLRHNAEGILTGIGDADIGPLRDTAGRVSTGKQAADAESMAWHAGGGTLIGYEQDHRIWRFQTADGAATAFPKPPGVEKASANRGLEALARLGDGRYLAIAEGLGTRDWTQGWIGTEAGQWQGFRYAREDRFRPTGAAPLPGGDALVLERRFSKITGLAIRLRRLKAADIAAGAVVTGELLATMAQPMNIDNFEGVETRQSPDGAILIYLISDDNFNFVQQTLLFQFRLNN